MKITVFTPTYNRAHTLPELYESLQKQRYKHFEWLVIDDGSSDQTDKLMRSWLKKDNGFEIRYFKVENGGKHRAINKGTDLAEGEMFFIVDSDDYLTEDALECIVDWEYTLDDTKMYCGVSGNRGKSKSNIWGTTFDGEYVDATNLERELYKITGDKAEVFYTSILKQYKFEEFPGENFITESTVWNKMAFDGYNLRYFNKVIYISDYLEDGLSHAGDSIFAANPQGTACLFKQQASYCNYGIKEKLSHYNAYYQLVKDHASLSKAAKYLEIHPFALLISIAVKKIKNMIRKRTPTFSG